MALAEFVHLHNHTHYSLLDGACNVKDLVDAAKKNEMAAVALTDHGVLFGAFEFYKYAKSQGVKPIVGCEVYIVTGGDRRERTSEINSEGKRKVYNHLILLAKNEEGYRNLLKLVTKGHTEGFYYKPRIDTDLLREYSSGLVALSACAGGVISPHLISGDYDRAVQVAKLYKDIFDQDFYIEVQDHALEAEEKVRALAPKLAKEVGLKLICTNDCHYIEQKHAIAHNILLHIKDSGKEKPDITKLRYHTDQVYFRTAKEMQKLFRNIPGAIESTMEVADKCNLTLSKDFKMPKFPIPAEAGVETLDAYLDQLTAKGLDRRFTSLTKDIEDRAQFELEVIKKMGYSGYFLIVQDFIAAARKMGVSVGPGRGSAAGSLVAYALGITNVDPLKYNLLFERFLNPERVSMPDIDIDFSDDKREKVIDYVREKYGRESVAQIITFSTLSARAVLKDVGRVLGVPLGTINEITQNIPVIMGRVTPLKEAIELPEIKAILARKDPLVQKLIEYSLVLEGFARSASKHAAGVVITPGDISDFVPLYKTPQLEEAVTQFNMKDVEEAGLLKMDFLGLRTLSIIDTTLALIEQNTGLKINIDDIPLDDKKTYELFGRGDTTAVFQFDSAPMQNYMRALKPENLEDLSSMNALYRPGPMEHIPEFIDCKHGRRAVEYLHPKLEPILQETYGVIVVQEQVMRIARDLAGFSLAKADEMRRAMGKKDLAKMESMKMSFIDGCVHNEIPEKTAKELYERLAKFASYGFNKSHSLAYSLISYQTAYLKANYIAEFLAANMTHKMSDSDYVVQLIDEAKKYNIATLPPDVNSSLLNFSASSDVIRFGLCGVKNVGEKAVEGIVAERLKNGPFTSLFNFTSRLDTRLVNRRAIEAMIEAGAFDSCDPSAKQPAQYRSDLFENVERALSFASQSLSSKQKGQDSLFGGSEEASSAPQEPQLLPAHQHWSELEMLSHEKKSIGYYVTGHPLEPHRVDILSFASHKSSELNDLKQNDLVFVGGVIVGIVRKLDKNGNAFAIVKLEDFAGKMECIFWSDAFKQFQSLVQDEAALFIRGKIRKGGPDEAPSILVQEALEIRAVRKKMTRGILVRMLAQDSGSELQQLQAICSKHKGSCWTMVAVEKEDILSPSKNSILPASLDHPLNLSSINGLPRIPVAAGMPVSDSQAGVPIPAGIPFVGTTIRPKRYKLPEVFSVEPSDALIQEVSKAFGSNRVLFCR